MLVTRITFLTLRNRKFIFGENKNSKLVKLFILYDIGVFLLEKKYQKKTPKSYNFQFYTLKKLNGIWNAFNTVKLKLAIYA